MFNTRKELLNLVGMVSMTLIFLDPNGTIATEDQADHNNLYVGFAYTQTAETATFPFLGVSGAYYDDDEE